MNVRVNGEERAVPEGTTLQGFLDGIALAGVRLAVELNRDVVPAERRAARVLREGDVLEVVTFVGGG